MECDDLLFLPINVLNCHYHIIVNQVFMNLIPNMSHLGENENSTKLVPTGITRLLFMAIWSSQIFFSRLCQKSRALQIRTTHHEARKLK
jgi:hypothetical protein